MSICPFLSNNIEEVDCFTDCCFYEGAQGKKCPFKEEMIKKFTLKDVEEEYEKYTLKDSLMNIIYERRKII